MRVILGALLEATPLALSGERFADPANAPAIDNALQRGARIVAAQGLLDRGEARLALGQYGPARADLAEAQAMFARMGMPEMTWETLYLTARSHAEEGESAEALALTGEAIARVEQVRNRLTTPALRAAYLGHSRAAYDLQIEVLMSMAEEAEPDAALALDGRWTATTWALEGAALVWVGIHQQRRLARWFGLLLQFGAGVAFLLSLDGGKATLAVWNGAYLGALMVCLAGLFSSWQLQRHKPALMKFEHDFTLPVLTIALYGMGYIARMTRASMAEVMTGMSKARRKRKKVSHLPLRPKPGESSRVITSPSPAMK